MCSLGGSARKAHLCANQHQLGRLKAGLESSKLLLTAGSQAEKMQMAGTGSVHFPVWSLLSTWSLQHNSFRLARFLRIPKHWSQRNREPCGNRITFCRLAPRSNSVTFALIEAVTKAYPDSRGEKETLPLDGVYNVLKEHLRLRNIVATISGKFSLPPQ